MDKKEKNLLIEAALEELYNSRIAEGALLIAKQTLSDSRDKCLAIASTDNLAEKWTYLARMHHEVTKEIFVILKHVDLVYDAIEKVKEQNV